MLLVKLVKFTIQSKQLVLASEIGNHMHECVYQS
jgi:hypothetical protein